jgi:hypothetical protein
MSATTSSEYRIIIGQRGWVWVGKYSRARERADDMYGYVTISEAYCIRTWGTSKGLGELCEGPTSETVVDPVGTVRMHELTVVATYDANDKVWQSHLLSKQ